MRVAAAAMLILNGKFDADSISEKNVFNGPLYMPLLRDVNTELQQRNIQISLMFSSFNLLS